MSKAIVLTGMRSGRLVAIRPTDLRKGNKVVWECKCDCGAVVHVRSTNLHSHQVQSCGCLRRDVSAELGRKLGQNKLSHGHARVGQITGEFHSWSSAIARCFNPKHRAFRNYGGRGITMCDRWRNSFAAFFEDMGPRPVGMSLDRWPNNDGNYEPGNCRWATSKQQEQTRRIRRDSTGKYATL